jgi:hypothetical protein
MDVDLEAMVTLSASLDCLTRTIQAEAEERARSTSRPRPLDLAASKVADASGNCILAFESCPQGQWWALRRLVVGGVTYSTTASGAAVVFKSTASAAAYNADADVALFNVVDATLAPTNSPLPSVAFYDGDAHLITLSPNEKICIRIYSGTASQQYAANAAFDIYQLGTFGNH